MLHYCRAFGDFRKAALKRLGEEGLWVLEELVESSPPTGRILAAAVCLAISVRVTGFAEVNSTLIKTCEKVICSAFAKTTPPTKLRFVCNMIGLCQRVPVRAVNSLRHLLTHESEIVRVSAAAAVCWDDKSLLTGVEVLRKSLLSDDLDVLAIYNT